MARRSQDGCSLSRIMPSHRHPPSGESRRTASLLVRLSLNGGGTFRLLLPTTPSTRCRRQAERTCKRVVLAHADLTKVKRKSSRVRCPGTVSGSISGQPFSTELGVHTPLSDSLQRHAPSKSLLRTAVFSRRLPAGTPTALLLLTVCHVSVWTISSHGRRRQRGALSTLCPPGARPQVTPHRGPCTGPSRSRGHLGACQFRKQNRHQHSGVSPSILSLAR